MRNWEWLVICVAAGFVAYSVGTYVEENRSKRKIARLNTEHSVTLSDYFVRRANGSI